MKNETTAQCDCAKEYRRQKQRTMDIKAMSTRDLKSLIQSIENEIEFRKSDLRAKEYVGKYFYVNESNRFRMINITETPDDRLVHGQLNCREITLTGRKRRTKCDSEYDSELALLSRCFESVILINEIEKSKPFPKEMFERIWKRLGEIDEDYNLEYEKMRQKFCMREDELAEETIDELNEMNITL